MNEKELAEKIENITFLTKTESKVLAFLLLHSTEDKTSREIEYTMFLRQPEVSMVLSTFYRYKWIKKSIIHEEKKGRPVVLIKLSKRPEVLLDELIEKSEKEINAKKEDRYALIRIKNSFVV